MTGPRSQGLLLMKLKSPGSLQSGELREFSSHEMAMLLWPPIFRNRMKPKSQLTKTFSSLCLTYSSQQPGRQAGWGLLNLPILWVEAMSPCKGIAMPSLHPDLQNLLLLPLPPHPLSMEGSD